MGLAAGRNEGNPSKEDRQQTKRSYPMRKLLFAVVAAAPLALLAAAPSPARASWLSQALHAYLDRDYYGGYYYYNPGYEFYYAPDYYEYAPWYGYYRGSYYAPYHYYRYGPTYRRPWYGNPYRWHERHGREWHGEHGHHRR
jgi:hypothetical protein